MRQVGRRIKERGHRDDYNTELEHIQRYEVNENPDKTNCLTTVQKDNMVAIPIAADSLAMLTPETRRKRVYDACGGRMELNGKIHPIRLADGFYLIRNLTLRECMRLQTARKVTVFRSVTVDPKPFRETAGRLPLSLRRLTNTQSPRRKPISRISSSLGTPFKRGIPAGIREKRLKNIIL